MLLLGVQLTIPNKFAFKALAKESWIDPAMSGGTERDGWLVLPVVNSIPLSLKVRPVLSKQPLERVRPDLCVDLGLLLSAC